MLLSLKFIFNYFIMLELNKIYLGDCLELMKQIPDKSIDLVLTDPPYWIGIKWKVGGEKLAKVKDYWDFNNRDNEIPSKEYFNEILRVSKNAIIFWWNYFIENLTNSSCWIVWDKNNSWNFADCELARTNFKSAVRMYKYTRNWMLQEDMSNKEAREHPTQKPVALIEYLVKTYTNEWEMVLDFTAGSFTTAMACENTNRKRICIEKDEWYYNIWIERVNGDTK